jgi:hypothetical protein
MHGASVRATSLPQIIAEDSLRHFLEVVPLRESSGESWALAAPFVVDYLPRGADRTAPSADELREALQARLDELAASFLAAFEVDAPDGEGLTLATHIRMRRAQPGAPPKLLPPPPELRRPKPRRGRPKDRVTSDLLEGLCATWVDFFGLPVTTSVHGKKASGKLLRFVQFIVTEVSRSAVRLCHAEVAPRVKSYLGRLTADAIRGRVQTSATRALLAGKPYPQRRQRRAESRKR